MSISAADRSHPASQLPVVRVTHTIADVSLVKSQFAPFTRVDEHEHSLSFFCLATEGSHTERIAATTLTRQRGSVVFHPASETHADLWGERGGSCLNIELGGSWRERVDSLRIRRHQHREWKGGQVTSWAGRVDRIASATRPLTATDNIEVEGLVLLMLAELARPSRAVERGARGAWVAQLRDYLHDEFRTANTLDSIAATFGVHPATLARAFRRAYGISVGAYIRLRRVEEACRLIERTDRPIGFIAHELGFADHSHCAREVRRVMGCAPSALRRGKQSTKQSAQAVSFTSKVRG